MTRKTRRARMTRMTRKAQSGDWRSRGDSTGLEPGEKRDPQGPGWRLAVLFEEPGEGLFDRI